MAIYSYEEAFGAADQTSAAMRRAISDWFSLYYGEGEGDTCQRVAYAVVSKLVRTVFGEYQAVAKDVATQSVLTKLNKKAHQAMELALVGGECYIKPCLSQAGFSFALLPRENVLIFSRDAGGRVTDMGTVEKTVRGRHYYTLLERRTLDAEGCLTIQNKLYRSLNAQNLGTSVPLNSHPDYGQLADRYRYACPWDSIGLIQIKTPILNCVDGSPDGVSVYGAAVGLIRAIDENEAQLRQEFIRGQSRIIASRDMLKDDGTGSLRLEDHLFIGLDEDPEQVGITVFSPELRQRSYLERKQEYLRNVESVIGLKRGMLSDANMEDRTATEIASSAGDYNLTVMDFQRMWEQAVGECLYLCSRLAETYEMTQLSQTVQIDWGNGILYDEDKTWESYQKMVADGLLKPEIALGWRFNMPAETEADRALIRVRLMP